MDDGWHFGNELILYLQKRFTELEGNMSVSEAGVNVPGH